MNHLQAGPRLAQMNTKESQLGVQSHQERKLDFFTNTCLLLNTTRCSWSCWLVSGEPKD